MKRASTALAQIGGVILATIFLAQAVSFGVVMATPLPAAPRMTVQDAARALANPEAARSLEFVRLAADAPPTGLSAPMVEAALGRALAVSPDRVRVVWHGRDIPQPTSERGEVRTWGPGDKTPSVTILPPSSSTLPVVLPESVMAAIAATPFPAFIAARQSEDGRWTIVRPAEPFLSGWRLRLLLAFALSAALLAPLGWLAARRLTRPLRQLASQAERAGLDASEPLAPSGPFEVRTAAVAIDAMRARLTAQAAERTRMVAAMAHDLRTPLTGLRLRIEKSPPAVRARMAEDIARMEALIAAMLAYAKGEEAPEERVPVDVSALVRDCADEARSHGGDVRCRIEAGLEMEGQPLALRRAVTNLLDNALRYAGAARLSLRRDAQRILMSVEDDGPGIPANEIDRIVAPFERGERSRSRSTGGAGLGLAIVRDVAARHGGRLVLASPPGAGLTATIDLPA